MVVKHSRAAQDDVQALRDIHQCEVFLHVDREEGLLKSAAHLELDLLEGDALVDRHVLR